MDGQGLQPVRSEIEAIVTFQAALNRLALQVDENALTEWTGPRPDDVDALAGDDGAFSYEELHEVRKEASDALSKRFREVLESVRSKAPVHEILKRAVLAGTGGVVHVDGPSPEAVLAALTRTGAIRQDWAQSAAILVREELAKLTTPVPKAKKAATRKKSAAKKPVKATKKKTPVKTRKAPKKTASKTKPKPKPKPKSKSKSKSKSKKPRSA